MVDPAIKTTLDKVYNHLSQNLLTENPETLDERINRVRNEPTENLPPHQDDEMNSPNSQELFPEPTGQEFEQISVFSMPESSSGPLDFTNFIQKQDPNYVDPNTAEGREIMLRTKEKERQNDAARVCINNYATCAEHLVHWPVSLT